MVSRLEPDPEDRPSIDPKSILRLDEDVLWPLRQHEFVLYGLAPCDLGHPDYCRTHGWESTTPRGYHTSERLMPNDPRSRGSDYCPIAHIKAYEARKARYQLAQMDNEGGSG